MIFVSLGVVGANLNYTVYLYLDIKPFGSYLHSQGAIIAFDVLLMIATPALFYTTYYSKSVQNMFMGILH